MPWFDKTEPFGRGPRTGKGLGPCGWGFGRGFWRKPLTKKEEIDNLSQYEKALKDELRDVQKEMDTLNK